MERDDDRVAEGALVRERVRRVVHITDVIRFHGVGAEALFVDDRHERFLALVVPCRSLGHHRSR